MNNTKRCLWISFFIATFILAASFLLTGCSGGGGGAGSNTVNDTSTTYNGLTTQASITQGNAKALADSGSYSPLLLSVVGGSGQGAPSYKGSPSLHKKTAALAPATLPGSCGGSEVTDSTFDSVTSRISGTSTYSGFCENGTTTDGQTTYSGTLTATNAYLNVVFTFTGYQTKDLSSNIITNGTASLTGTFQSGGISNGALLLNTNVKDGISYKVIKMENIATAVTVTSPYTDLSISGGKVYHPDFGYVAVASSTTIRTMSGDKHPSSGVLVLTGANNTKVKVTCLSSTQYKVEVDGTGSGVYVIVNTYDWTTLSASGTAPTISTVSPPSGAVGATVTITGTNFSATAANNTVKFSGTQATVTSATATQITAIVPTGAITGPITVATTAGTVTSSAPFTVTASGNTTVVGFWALSTENGAPVPGLDVSLILNPDNTYIMAIISSSTGSYVCEESGTYSCSGTVMSDTILASTCDAGSVNKTETADYSVSGSSLTTTTTDTFHTVHVWTKLTIPPQLVGKWGTMSVSGTQFYNSSTGAWADTNGGGTEYEFKPDGTYTEATYIQSSMYSCSTTIFVWITGSVSVSGTTMTLTETEHYLKDTDTCMSSANYDGPKPLQTHTYPWSIEQITDPYLGTAQTTLILDEGFSSGPSEYPKEQ